MVAELEDAVRSFSGADHEALMAGLVVAVTWEAAFLANPSGAVWTPMFVPDREESLAAAGQRYRRCRACGERFRRALIGGCRILDDRLRRSAFGTRWPAAWPARARRRMAAPPAGWTGAVRTLTSAGLCDR